MSWIERAMLRLAGLDTEIQEESGDFEAELLKAKREGEEQATIDERERQDRYAEALNRQRQADFERRRVEEERLRELSKLAEPFKADVDGLMNGLGLATFGKGKYGYDFVPGDGKIIQKWTGYREEPVVLGESIAQWRVGRVKQHYARYGNRENRPDRIIKDLNFMVDYNSRDGYGNAVKEFFETHLVLLPDGNISFVSMDYVDGKIFPYSFIEAASINSLRQTLTERFLKGPSVTSVPIINFSRGDTQGDSIRMGG